MMKRIVPLAVVAVALTTATVTLAQPPGSSVPDNLKAPAQNVLLFKTMATGAQVYVCKAKADNPDAFEWTFKAPVAELLNETGEHVGKHYAGPTWEGNDGSKVIGEVVERANASDPGAIPLLLLKAKSNEGAGAFSSVTFVQRLETVGGVAPTDGCDRSAADVERSVEYTATYAFYYGAAR
jgi:hypothetical protein